MIPPHFKKPVFTLPCPPLGEVRAGACSKGLYNEICGGVTPDNAVSIVKKISPDINGDIITVTGAAVFLREYITAVENFCNDNPDLYKVPEKPDYGDSEELLLRIQTYPERLVHEYSGYSFSEINELNILFFRMLLADAVKLKILSRSDGKGIEYLNECYNYMHRISNMFD